MCRTKKMERGWLESKSHNTRKEGGRRAWEGSAERPWELALRAGAV